ncbi:13940_t:CDS:2 [Entrophospora sp. SA101]|nr:13940_t:CDS:2 [Entrophospora sp. SA101]
MQVVGFSSNSSNTGDPTTTTTSNNNNSTSTNETNNTVFGPVFIGPERMNYDITNNTGINIPSGTNGSSHHFRPLDEIFSYIEDEMSKLRKRLEDNESDENDIDIDNVEFINVSSSCVAGTAPEGY